MVNGKIKSQILPSQRQRF